MLGNILNRTRLHNSALYLDELTFTSTCWLILNCKKSSITVLEDIKLWQKFYIWTLWLKSIDVNIAKFSLGKLEAPSSEGIYFAARKLSWDIAQEASIKLIESNRILFELNKQYGQNIIQLFICKKIKPHIEFYLLRIMVALALKKSGKPLLWLKLTPILDEGLVSKKFPNIDVEFYPPLIFISLIVFKTWLIYFLSNIKKSLLSYRLYFVLPTKLPKQRPSVLSIQEDTIRADLHLRGQPHWINTSLPSSRFDTYIVEIARYGNIEDYNSVAKMGVTVLSKDIMPYCAWVHRDNKTLLRLGTNRRIALDAVFCHDEIAEKFWLVEVANFLRQAQLIGALALHLNTKVFLVRETYYLLSDAMHLVASGLNVTTIAYQYSNLGSVTPGLMSTSDKFLIFSEMFKKVFQNQYFAPKKFDVVGYLYDGIPESVMQKAINHRELLFKKGVNFVICYFDESVQNNKWGLISREGHLCELHALCRALLTDPSLGVIVKSQFIQNTPSKLYPNDQIIQKAKHSGRYLELFEGYHRNDIYPAEAAISADICISHKFGATAGLEASIYGIRTILLNTYKIKTLWDSIYAEANLEFNSIESALVAIASYRLGEDQQTLGDWEQILNYFTPFRNGLAISRLRDIIEQNI